MEAVRCFREIESNQLTAVGSEKLVLLFNRKGIIKYNAK
jgi:hypothetical protein